MDGLKNYTVVNADFVTKINEQQADLTMIGVSKACGQAFVEVVKHSTDKSLDGASMRTRRGIIVLAYNSICEIMEVATNMIIHGVVYGNLEVTEIVGNKTKVQISGFA